MTQQEASPAPAETPSPEEDAKDGDTAAAAAQTAASPAQEPAAEQGVPMPADDADPDQDQQPNTPAPDQTTASEQAVATAEAEQTSAYHHHALVVDDSAAIRKQLELELRAAGISADFAETGEQALEQVDHHPYDLVFLDIIMPGIDGYETCRQMRTRQALKKTPIIMLSAKTSPLDEVQGVIAGASTYLTKPVKSEQLQKTLKRVSMWLDNFSA
ncbi:MAG: response regulator [Thiolinea sp.]